MLLVRSGVSLGGGLGDHREVWEGSHIALLETRVCLWLAGPPFVLRGWCLLPFTIGLFCPSLRADLGTTQVWTVWVHLHAHLFQ